MPKMKTNRTAKKKLKIGGKGRVRRANANKSHYTAKKSSKRMRRLRQTKTLDRTNEAAVRRLLPYG